MAIWGVKSENNLKKMCKELEVRVTHIEGATGTLNMNNVNARNRENRLPFFCLFSIYK